MAKIALVGSPGQGKTTSVIPFSSDKLGVHIKGLDPKTTVLIDVKNQGAFPGYDADKKLSEGGNYFATKDSPKVASAIKYIADNRQDIKCIWIDDMGYLMSFEQTANAKNKGHNIWVDLAYNHMSIYDAVEYAMQKRKDLHFIACYHSEVGKDNKMKIKTCGQMIDNTVTLDGLYNIILYAEVNKTPDGKVIYQFRTHNDGVSSCRSPLGMFEEELIPNDMGVVMDAVNKYYNVQK